MRTPDFHLDGWCLEDGEQRQKGSPSTFPVPDISVRNALQRGDYAKLIFKIAVDDGSDEIERMWVLVRDRVGAGYLGVLDNDPDCIGENEELWSGAELPFEPRHIIDVLPADEKSLVVAEYKPRRIWV